MICGFCTGTSQDDALHLTRQRGVCGRRLAMAFPEPRRRTARSGDASTGPKKPARDEKFFPHHLERGPRRPLSAFDVIFTRRSIRSYTGETIDADTVRALLDAAVQAPTALHSEPWLFVVIQDAAVLKQYSDQAKASWLNELTSQADLHRPRGGDARRFREHLRDPAFSPCSTRPAR